MSEHEPMDPSAAWRKSTHSSGSSDCVEVAVQYGPFRPGMERATGIVVRDSKNPDRGTLHVTSQQWRAFLEHMKYG